MGTRLAYNVVLYVIDALRPDHCSLYGYDRPTTPCLEQLATDAVVFEKAYSVSTWTKPVAASILSGAYPALHGVRMYRDIYTGRTHWLPDILRRAGYATCGISSIGNVSSSLGFAHGFEDFLDLYKEPKLKGVRQVSTSDEWRLYHEADTTVLLPLGEDVTRYALTWLQAHSGNGPFFLFLWTMDPHDPYNPPSQFRHFLDPLYKGRSDGSIVSIRRARTRSDVQRLIDLYDGEIAYADSCLGMFIDDLKEMGIYDETLLIVMSDHGEAFGEHGDFGHGHIPFEETARVLLVMKLPYSQFAGYHVDQLVTLVDIMPTILDYTGLIAETPTSPFIQGRSLRPTIERREAVHEQVFLETQATEANPQIYAVRSVRWKYVSIQRSSLGQRKVKDVLRHLSSRASLGKILSNPVFYIRRRFGYASEMLFDLESAPCEQQNVARNYPAITENMRALLTEWLMVNQDLSTRGSFDEFEAPQVDEATIQHLRALGYLD